MRKALLTITAVIAAAGLAGCDDKPKDGNSGQEVAADTLEPVIEGVSAPQPETTSTLVVSNGFARETAEGMTVGGGFIDIVNGGAAGDRLVSVSSPVAEETQLHEAMMENGVMQMREVEGGIAIPAGSTVHLKPGGYHLMFMRLKAPLKAGDVIDVTLNFKQSGPLKTQLEVRALSDLGPAADGAKTEPKTETTKAE